LKHETCPFWPSRFLKKGDLLSLGLEGLGQQRQLLVPFKY